MRDLAERLTGHRVLDLDRRTLARDRHPRSEPLEDISIDPWRKHTRRARQRGGRHQDQLSISEDDPGDWSRRMKRSFGPSIDMAPLTRRAISCWTGAGGRRRLSPAPGGGCRLALPRGSAVAGFVGVLLGIKVLRRADWRPEAIVAIGGGGAYGARSEIHGFDLERATRLVR
jgi:hypothetical protein